MTTCRLQLAGWRLPVAGGRQVRVLDGDGGPADAGVAAGGESDPDAHDLPGSFLSFLLFPCNSPWFRDILE